MFPSSRRLLRPQHHLRLRPSSAVASRADVADGRNFAGQFPQHNNLGCRRPLFQSAYGPSPSTKRCEPWLHVATFSSASEARDATRQDRPRGGGRGRREGGRRKSKSVGHAYTQVGGPINPVICTLNEEEIHQLIAQRLRHRRAHDFQRADEILTQLNKRGVQMDDAAKEWWADGRRMIDCRDTVNEYGHGYTQVGGRIDLSTCELTEEAIHALIRERTECRRAREFARADEVRDRLNESGVQISDDLMQWWVVGARIRDRQAIVKEHGHNYKQVGSIDLKVCKLGEEEIHELIRDRMRCRNKKEFGDADEILKELKQAGVHLDDEAKQWRADGVPFSNSKASHSSPKMKDCWSLEEAIDATHANLHNSTARDIAAFWAVVPSFIGLNSTAPRLTDRKAKLGAILARTLENLDTFGPRELSTTALGLAKVVKQIGGDEEGPTDEATQILRDILIGEESKNRLTIFRHIARASIAALDGFDARCLANLAYAYAIAGYAPTLKDGSTLLDRVADRSLPILDKFRPQGLSNILWSHATLRISNEDLFEEAAETIVSMDLHSFTPQDLSNIVWAYATVECSHPDLLEKIAKHIIEPDVMETFNGQDCADTMWAYASTKVANPKLFEEFAKHIVNNLRLFGPQHLSTIVWAYTAAGESRESLPELFDKIADAASKGKGMSNRLRKLQGAAEE